MKKLISKKRKISYDSDDEDSNYGEAMGAEIKRNHIYLNGEINKDSITDLIDEIDRVSYDIIKVMFKYDIPTLPIYLHINSSGGCVHSAFRACDKILKNPVYIYTVVDGYCASAATFISIVGHKRFASQHSYFLIHQLSHGHGGKLRDLKDSLTNCKNIDKRIKELYLSKTKMDSKHLDSLIKKELEFNVDKALELGFIDSIY